MALKGYTNEAQVQSILNSSVSVSDTDLEIAENIVDNYTGRNFIADAVASVRYYDGNDSDRLAIDDCVEISSIEVNGDRIQSSGFLTVNNYYLYPDNYESKGLPIDLIVLYDNYFYKGNQNQKITAKWGYSVECPADVSFATAVICAGIINFNSSSNIKSENIGNYSVSYETEDGWASFNKAKTILLNYRKIEL